MDRKEYMRLKEQAHRRYQEDVTAIERVWGLSQNGSQATGSTKNTARTRVGATSDVIRSIVDTMTGEFSFKDVQKALTESAPETKITPRYVVTFLKRLAARQYVEVTRRGGPNKGPTIYRRKVH